MMMMTEGIERDGGDARRQEENGYENMDEEEEDDEVISLPEYGNLNEEEVKAFIERLYSGNELIQEGDGKRLLSSVPVCLPYLSTTD